MPADKELLVAPHAHPPTPGRSRLLVFTLPQAIFHPLWCLLLMVETVFCRCRTAHFLGPATNSSRRRRPEAAPSLYAFPSPEPAVGAWLPQNPRKENTPTHKHTRSHLRMQTDPHTQTHIHSHTQLLDKNILSHSGSFALAVRACTAFFLQRRPPSSWNRNCERKR